MRTIRVFSVVGARPQFVKIAPVSRELRDRQRLVSDRLDDFIVHTGQHYDANMSDVFFRELGIPEPAANLGVGSFSHGEQTARMLSGLETLMIDAKPDVVVVYGDTNSTIAGALAAAKLHLPVVHVEAGLRSFNRQMPEELNRVATDHLADSLLAPTKTAMENLACEGLGQRACLTGDVMYDAVMYGSGVAERRSDVLARFDLSPGRYRLATVHRAENTGPAVLPRLLLALESAGTRDMPLLLPLHPRTRDAIRNVCPRWSPPEHMRVVEPLSYLDTLAAVRHCACVITDSGGLQKEAVFLGRPCVTLREETEWTETVTEGANVLAGCDGRKLLESLDHWAKMPGEALAAAVSRGARCFGDGRAAMRIVDGILALGGASRS